jgi:hypothetical protein
VRYCFYITVNHCPHCYFNRTIHRLNSDKISKHVRSIILRQHIFCDGLVVTLSVTSKSTGSSQRSKSSLPHRLFPSLGNQPREKPIFLVLLLQCKSKTKTPDCCLVDCSGCSMHLSRPKRLRRLVRLFVNLQSLLQSLFLREPSLPSTHESMEITSHLQTLPKPLPGLMAKGRLMQHRLSERCMTCIIAHDLHSIV